MPDALRFLILTAAGWVNRHQEDVIDYLREENRVLPGATWPTSTSPDRRPAPSTRGARPETRPADSGAGRQHRHTRHDSPLVPEADCPGNTTAAPTDVEAGR